MIKVLYVGDAAAVLGTSFIASPFNLENKGFSIHIWCKPVLDALSSDGEIEVTHMTNWDAYRDFPKTPEEFKKYNVVFLGDVESEVLLLYPEWTKAPMGPNRLRSLRDYVAGGGSLCMIGGWSSFSGRFGTAAYQNTPVEEALPVKCVPAGDDRVETPEGTWIEVLDEKHPVTRNIPWEKCPCFLGYNRIIAKEGANGSITVNFSDKRCGGWQRRIRFKDSQEVNQDERVHGYWRNRGRVNGYASCKGFFPVARCPGCSYL